MTSIYLPDSQTWVDLYEPQPACSCRPHCGLPPCTECGEDHGGHDHGNGVHLCRDCDLEYRLTGMRCSVCQRMRYRSGVLGGLGESLWGERCRCAPGTPSVRDAADASIRACDTTRPA
jgi:hypothetical protein